MYTEWNLVVDRDTIFNTVKVHNPKLLGPGMLFSTESAEYIIGLLNLKERDGDRRKKDVSPT